jgi:hypothetical protein
MDRRPELDRRLDVLAAPGYDDPARAHLTVADWLAVVLFLAVICGGVFVWAL